MSINENVKKIYWFKLLFCVLGSLAVYSISMLIGGSMESYKSLNLPAIAPPIWAFPLFGCILSALAGASAYILWCTVVSEEKEVKSKKIAFVLFIAQLIVSVFWPLMFFRLEQFVGGVVVLVVLTLINAAYIYFTYRQNRLSAYTMIPYAAWFVFLLYLNIMALSLN